MENNKLIFCRHISTCYLEIQDWVESSKRIMQDCIESRLLEPIQEKMQSMSRDQSEIEAMKNKMKEEKEYYEDIIIEKWDDGEKLVKYTEELEADDEGATRKACSAEGGAETCT